MYKNKMCVITDVIPTHLGFNSYCIEDLVTGEEFSVAKHCLKAVEFEEMTDPDSDLAEWQANFERDMDKHKQKVGSHCVQEDEPYVTIHGLADSSDSPAPAKKQRHASMTEEELVQLEGKRLCANTQKQTKWAVALLKGT